MGTNYYHYLNKPCPTCGHAQEPRHIGKSSAGWCFSLRVYPDEGIVNLTDWFRLLGSGTIKNEYSETLTREQMMECIMLRERKVGGDVQPHKQEFLYANSATIGPNGMLRSQRCYGHGEGTWDYVDGEFS